MHYQFFCTIGARKLPSIVITASNYRQAAIIANGIYEKTIAHFKLASWNINIDGYYVGRNVTLTELSARLANV